MNAMFNTYSAVTLLLAISSVVLAQAETQHDESEAEPSAVGIAAMVVDGAFILVNLVFIIACVIFIRRLPGHRWPFATLCGASVFFVMRGVMNIVFNDFTGPGSSIDAINLADLLFIVADFFTFWAYSLLSASLGLILLDRVKSISRGAPLKREEKVIFGILFGLVGLLVLLGSIVPWLGFFILIVVFLAIWAFTILYITYVAAHVYQKTRRSGAQDKVSRMMLIAIMPLSICGMILGCIFALLPFLLISDTLLAVFFSTIIGLILSLGIDPENWKNHIEIVDELAHIGSSQDADYVKMKDPPPYHK